jgi:uncharacterized protein (DUF2249 family)
MASESVDITPEMRVGALLDAYPQLEDKLIALTPAFAKLRNPVLRRTVAKVTTLRQAAKVGKITLGTLINTLRAEVGQVDGAFEDESDSTGEPPVWFDEKKILETMDGRPMIEAGERPLDGVVSMLGRLSKGEILELTTPFEPVPLIDMAKQKGFQVWSKEESPEVFKTYFHRAN